MTQEQEPLPDSPTAPVVPAVMVGAIADFLAKHPPFNDMDAASLRYLASHVKMAYHPKGAVIVSPAAGPVRTLSIIQRGAVRARMKEARDAGQVLEFTTGEPFPIGAVMGQRPTSLTYEAVEDTFCYEAPADVIDALARDSVPFQRYCTQHIDTLLRQANDRLRVLYGEEPDGSHAMLAPISSVMTLQPVRCAPGTALKEAVERMVASNVGSIVITDASDVPRGIVTERDLLRVTAEGRLALDQPIETVMSSALVCMPGTATVTDAGVLMARHGIRHLLVVDDGKLVGVVSERNLYSMQRLSMRQVAGSIERAPDIESLRHAALDIHKLVRNLMGQGVAPESLARFISTLNDKLTERIVMIEAARHGVADLPWCWLALGSEGRHEQTFSTDQDNALIFRVGAGGNVAAVRARLLPFAEAVNKALDSCGFPLCEGDIMAGNASWCMDLEEWKIRFGHWIRHPTAEALLNASIFFDFRGLCGDLALASELRGWLREEARSDQAFLRTMAVNALRVRPPGGFLGVGLAVNAGIDAEAGTVDLKMQGTRVIVDGARVLALAAGVTETSTAARVRAVSVMRGGTPSRANALLDAFHFLLLLRMRRQEDLPIGMEAKRHAGRDNRVNPDELHELDRRILKESFRQAQKMQRRLADDFKL